MNNTEAITLLKSIADRRLMIHVNGTVMEAEPDEVQEALDLAIAALERERWISVEERLPENLTSVLVRRKDCGIFVWEYIGSSTTDEVWIDDCCNIYSIYDSTHWMPLPEPPKEDKP